MESRHTPGPWTVERSGDGLTRIVTLDQSQGWPTQVAMPYHVDDGDEEILTAFNAHLIAAAPDLLSALDWLLNAHQGLSIKEWIDAVDAGHAAIAKARGERSR